MSKTMPLDELEVSLQLVMLDKPELKYQPYQVLKEVIEKEFDAEVKLEDVYLLFEPTISQDQIDMEIHYGAMFNLTRYDQ